MAQIQWYPGHMAKAEREIEKNIKLVDIVIQLVDARAPLSSYNDHFDYLIKNKKRLIIMTKEDMADKQKTKEWISYYKSQGLEAMSINLKTFHHYNMIISKCQSLLKEERERDTRRGLKPRPVRAMVIGIPNVGKSTFINALAKRKATVTGNKPGVTKSQQIIRIQKDFELFDTPGILTPKFGDKQKAMNTALIGSIKLDILPRDDVFIYAIRYLSENYPEVLKERYQLTVDLDDDWILPVYDHISTVKHIPKLRGETDYEKVMDAFFSDLFGNKLGAITWESVISD